MKRIELTKLVFGFGIITLGSAPLRAQTAADTPTVTTAEVTAKDVYVRSGDSMNHYTIRKLQAGDRVTVVSERGEWVEIVPPEGTFSLVSGDFVDTTDNQTGTINGDNVRVRAGSLLNENKYTVQTLLPKGTPVTILGRNPDGFVRIKPPAGATLWVNRAYVNLGPATDATTANALPAQPVSIEANASESVASATPVMKPVIEEKPKKAAELPALGTTALRRQLEEIDAAAQAELAKPLTERRFDPIIARYQPIADQTEDDFAREYAKARIQQVSDFGDLASAIAKVNSLDEQAKAYRYQSLAARSLIPEPTPLTEPAGIEVQGLLKVSALYPPGSPTPRYRLIDPTSDSERTIGYVEVPAEVSVKVDEFLGRYVGVRASAQRIQTGGVNPIPIYIARELVLMAPPAGSKLSQAGN